MKRRGIEKENRGEGERESGSLAWGAIIEVGVSFSVYKIFRDAKVRDTVR